MFVERLLGKLFLGERIRFIFQLVWEKNIAGVISLLDMRPQIWIPLLLRFGVLLMPSELKLLKDFIYGTYQEAFQKHK